MHERDRARQRLLITLVLALASTWAAYDASRTDTAPLLLLAVPAMLVAYALATVIHRRRTLAHGAPGLLGQYGFMVLDSVVIVLALVGAPEILAPFYSVLMVQMVRCGMRYGVPTLWLSWGAAALAAAVLMPFSDFWTAEPALLSSFVVMMVIVPVLFGPFVRSLHQAGDDLRHAADTDALTGLSNRRALTTQLHEACRRTARDGRVLAVMLFDLDNFKRVNDTLGHATGDLLLKAVADALRKEFRPGETMARLGGDEFVVLIEGFPTDTCMSTARERAVSLIARIETMAATVAPGMQVSASAGVHCWTASSRHPEADGDTRASDLLKAADHAMYGCKRAGKGTVAVTASPALVAQATPPGALGIRSAEVTAPPPQERRP